MYRAIPIYRWSDIASLGMESVKKEGKQEVASDLIQHTLFPSSLAHYHHPVHKVIGKELDVAHLLCEVMV